ncbi:MAG: radical SAM protein, partial [Armatimonadota bacterium]
MSRIFAPLVEIFASFQGEGLYVGIPQVFVRLAGCDLNCLYCDTRYARQIPEQFSVFTPEGEETLPNPAAVSDIVETVISRWNTVPSVSITGGEPLLHPQFVAAVGRALRAGGIEVHLE